MIDYLMKNGIEPFIGKNETYYLNLIEEIKDIKIKRGFRIVNLGYIVDGYCEETNTVYEIYEGYHKKPTQRMKDEKRKNNIVDFLKCKFIIIWDSFDKQIEQMFQIKTDDILNNS
jgi:very-short-patch-repair endonuclease